MTDSPTKNLPRIPPASQTLSSPRSSGRLRKLQSAHQLGSSGPSLISQQRQQQQLNTTTSQNPPVPSIPAHHSPHKHARTRSNSDAVVPSFSIAALTSKKPTAPKKTPNPKDELQSLVRQGPKGNAALGLENLRHWILCDGMDADGDGMV